MPRRHGAWTQLLAAGQHLGSQHFSSRAADMAQILACVAATCPGVAQIDVEGCSEEAQLRALAVPLRRANSGCGATPGITIAFLCADVCAAAKVGLERVRAFLSHHEYLQGTRLSVEVCRGCGCIYTNVCI